jgi:hypothetical protein
MTEPSCHLIRPVGAINGSERLTSYTVAPPLGAEIGSDNPDPSRVSDGAHPSFP